MNDKLKNDTLFNSDLIIISHYFDMIGLKIPKQVVRNAFLIHDNYPKILFKDILVILKNLHLQAYTYQLSPNDLFDLQLPLLVYIKETNYITSLTSIGKFVIIETISHDCITYLDPSRQKFSVTYDDFCNLWTGLLLDIDFDEDEILSLFAKERYEELSQLANYKASIKVINNFLTKDDCQNFIKYCEDELLFETCKLHYIFHKNSNNHKSLESALIFDREVSLISNIYDKIQKVFNVQINNVGNFQCKKIRNSNIPIPHFDEISFKKKYTLYIFLNESLESGGLYFPELEYIIYPKSGKAVIFQNVDEDDNVIPYSIHEEHAFESHTKFVCNTWFSEKPLHF